MKNNLNLKYKTYFNNKLKFSVIFLSEYIYEFFNKLFRN